MSMKKTLCGLLAASLAASMASVGVFAATALTGVDRTGKIAAVAASVVDEDGNALSSSINVDDSVAGRLTIDTMTPASTFYVRIDDATLTNGRSGAATTADLDNDKLFSFSADKKTNSKLVKSIEYVSDKQIGSVPGRNDWLKITLNDSTMTSEQKFEGTVTFKSRKTSDSAAPHNGFSGDIAYIGDTYTLGLNLWINNNKITDGDNPDAGDRVFFEPSANDTNTLIWGDDRAALKFDSNNSGDKFYARLSTKSNQDVYRTYGDPVNADLYFFDFVGNPQVPSTSRATLTLGTPWDEDDGYMPNPADCFIYQLTAEGDLIDITENFIYSEDDQDISGWTTKTRVLGTYVLSDTELEIEVQEDAPVEETPDDTGKDIPNTGSGSLPSVAVATGLLSLLAAGAVCMKKSR